MSAQPRAPYISSTGEILSTPPLGARISRFGNDVYNFVGLYFTSLFSLDPYTAAQNSQFNTRGNRNGSTTRAGTGYQASRSGGVGGGGADSGRGRGSGGRRMGTVDDVRGPECGSCQ